MLDRTDMRRRQTGLFCLASATGLLVLGLTVLESRLKGMAFVAYWLACFSFTFLAILTALLDVRALRRKSRREQRGLVQTALTGKPGSDDAGGLR